jgi:hypothetical protein
VARVSFGSRLPTQVSGPLFSIPRTRQDKLIHTRIRTFMSVANPPLLTYTLPCILTCIRRAWRDEPNLQTTT